MLSSILPLLSVTHGAAIPSYRLPSGSTRIISPALSSPQNISPTANPPRISLTVANGALSDAQSWLVNVVGRIAGSPLVVIKNNSGLSELDGHAFTMMLLDGDT